MALIQGVRIYALHIVLYVVLVLQERTAKSVGGHVWHWEC